MLVSKIYPLQVVALIRIAVSSGNEKFSSVTAALRANISESQKDNSQLEAKSLAHGHLFIELSLLSTSPMPGTAVDTEDNLVNRTNGQPSGRVLTRVCCDFLSLGTSRGWGWGDGIMEGLIEEKCLLSPDTFQF